MVCFLWWNAENTTDIRQNVKFTSVRQHGGKRRSTGPILLYHNHVATFQLLLSGDIETNPGPVTCTLCRKTVRRNSLQYYMQRLDTCQMYKEEYLQYSHSKKDYGMDVPPLSLF